MKRLVGLSDYEVFNQIVTADRQRSSFISMNTNPLPEYDDQGQPVHRIRYTGITGNKNQWTL